MSDFVISEIIKAHMRRLVEQTNRFHSIYKYLTFDSAYQMLLNMNIQFTKASKLNDDYECDFRKCSFDRQIEILSKVGMSTEKFFDKVHEQERFFKSIGICSCGIKPDNQILWHRYASSNGSLIDGLCIEIDQDKIINNLLSKKIQAIALLVYYVKDINSFIPWDLALGNDYAKTYFVQYLYSTKEECLWREEDEIRLIYSEPIEGDYFRPTISNDCIKSVTFGPDISIEQRKKIGQLLNRYKSIKRHFYKP